MTPNTLLPALTLFATLALAAPAAAAPLGQWSLDEGSGQSVADASPSRADGRLGAFSVPDSRDPAWIPGRLGSALRFDAARDQYVAIKDPSVFQPDQVSVEAWVRRLGSPGSFSYVVSSGSTACRSAPYGLYTGAGGGLAFYVSDAAGFVLSPAALPARVWDGSWHQAVGTYDGRAVRLYLDGAQVGAGTSASLSIAYGAAASGVYLGSYRGSCVRPFTGDIDMVSIHPEALRSEQVGQSNDAVGFRPLPPQVVPVSGPPARTPAAPRKRCLSVRVTPKRLVKGRRSSLLIRVKRRGRPARGLRVAIRAPGVRRNVRTGRKGRARITVKPRRAGRLRVGATRQPAYCAPRVLKVARRR